MNTRTIPEIIDAFGGATAFARAIGIKPSAASEMKRRCSIPSGYWQAVVDAETLQDAPRVTYEELAEAHRERVTRTDDDVKFDMLVGTWGRASDAAKSRFLAEIGISDRVRRSIIEKPEVAA